MQIAVNGRYAISKKGGREGEREEFVEKRESDVFICINSISVLA